jgi:hypothetical protein
MGAADLEVVDGIGSVNVTLVELPEDLLKKQLGEAFCDLLFLIATSQSKRTGGIKTFLSRGGGLCCGDESRHRSPDKDCFHARPRHRLRRNDWPAD